MKMSKTSLYMLYVLLKSGEKFHFDFYKHKDDMMDVIRTFVSQ